MWPGDQQDNGGGLIVKEKHKGSYFTIGVLIENLITLMREKQWGKGVC